MFDFWISIVFEIETKHLKWAYFGYFDLTPSRPEQFQPEADDNQVAFVATNDHLTPE